MQETVPAQNNSFQFDTFNNSEADLKRTAEILRKHHRAKNYFYTGNILANAIEIEGYKDSQLYEDLFTIAAEDTIRENFGFYSYERKHEELSKINSQLERALDQSHGQIPEYELPRNFQNFINNNHLLTARSDEDSEFHKRPFLEISPPPKSDEVLLQEEIFQRGYTDHSYVLISLPEIDAEGNKTEKAIQFWTNKFNNSQWHGLLDKLAELSDIDSSESAGFSNRHAYETRQYGADIIARGGFLNVDQKNYLQDFLIKNKVEAKIGEIENVDNLKKHFVSTIKNRFGNDLLNLFGKSRNLENFEEIEPDLYELSNKLISLNNEIKLFIRDLFDKPAAHSDQSQSFESFNSMSDMERYALVEKVGFDIRFCGGKVKSYNTALGRMLGFNAEISGLGGKIIGKRSSDRPDLSEPCDGCGARWWIKEGNSKTYEPQCRGCGKSVYCA